MHLDVNNTFRIDFDAFEIMLTLIFVANPYIQKYPHHPQQA